MCRRGTGTQHRWGWSIWDRLRIPLEHPKPPEFRLREVRPLIVDDSYDDAGQNVRRMCPRLAGFILTHYQPDRRFGRFRVLRWDSERTRP